LNKKYSKIGITVNTLTKYALKPTQAHKQLIGFSVPLARNSAMAVMDYVIYGVHL